MFFYRYLLTGGGVSLVTGPACGGGGAKGVIFSLALPRGGG